MSTVSVGNVVDYNVSIQDGDGNTRSTTISRAQTGTTTIAQIATEAQAVVNAIDPLTTGKIIRVSINLTGEVTGQLPLDGDKALSEVERKGSFVFKLGNGSTSKVEIPSLVPDVVIAKVNTIDETNSDVVAFVNFMLGAGAGDPSVSSYGVALSELLTARKIHRRNSKG